VERPRRRLNLAEPIADGRDYLAARDFSGKEYASVQLIDIQLHHPDKHFHDARTWRRPLAQTQHAIALRPGQAPRILARHERSTHRNHAI
jgi:hypothetical protein